MRLEWRKISGHCSQLCWNWKVCNCEMRQSKSSQSVWQMGRNAVASLYCVFPTLVWATACRSLWRLNMAFRYCMWRVCMAWRGVVDDVVCCKQWLPELCSDGGRWGEVCLCSPASLAFVSPRLFPTCQLLLQGCPHLAGMQWENWNRAGVEGLCGSGRETGRDVTLVGHSCLPCMSGPRPAEAAS